MLRSVVRSTSLVRLRPVITGRAASSFSVVSSRPAAIITVDHAFPRCFSVATTEDSTVKMDEAPLDTFEVNGESAKKKSKRTRKKRDQPSNKKARRLFDEIAPHLPLETLNAIVRKFKRNAPKLEKETRVGQVLALLETASIPPWTRQRFTEFFLEQKFVEYEEPESFPVNVNKAELNSHVDMLMKAQDLAAQKPPVWSRTQRQKIARSKQKAAAASDESGDDDDDDDDDEDDSVSTDKPEHAEDTLSDALAIHKAKSEETRHKEAEELALLLAERLPEKAFHNLMDLFTTYVQETTNPKKPKLRMLYSKLSKLASSHIHLIAQDVAVFLYVNHSAHLDPRVYQREKKWDAAKEQFVTTILEVCKALDTPTTNNKQVRGLLNDNSETYEELEKLRTRPSDGVKVERDRAQKVGRRRKKVHLVFDAMRLQDDWEVPTQQQHIAFVDNLPIDMEEMDLFDLFSRCGPVQSVQIYNQREELDPGPLSARKRRERKVKQRQSMSRNRHRWKRPRTPVYAQINFTSQEGYDNAVDAPVRIFGMVVRKHPMRSIRTDDMTNLYLEDIPEGMYSLDIEHKLSQLLHPEIYLSLDVGQHDFAEPSSCEIKFPSFSMAHHAYEKLQDLDIEGASLQWLRTPEDAMKYWTREYSFET